MQGKTEKSDCAHTQLEGFDKRRSTEDRLKDIESEEEAIGGLTVVIESDPDATQRSEAK